VDKLFRLSEHNHHDNPTTTRYPKTGAHNPQSKLARQNAAKQCQIQGGLYWQPMEHTIVLYLTIF